MVWWLIAIVFSNCLRDEEIRGCYSLSISWQGTRLAELRQWSFVVVRKVGELPGLWL